MIKQHLKTIGLKVFFPILILSSCNYKTEGDTNSYEKPIGKQQNGELLKTLKEKDSLLFQIGFNQLDTLQLLSLVSEDFEFYHDLSGVTGTKAAFVQSIKSIGDLPFKTWRKLVKDSMEVYPLHKNNGQILYGAIQTGVHDFYQQHKGKQARKTSTARFTHLWILENDHWKLKRVLSYDHHHPND